MLTSLHTLLAQEKTCVCICVWVCECVGVRGRGRWDGVGSWSVVCICFLDGRWGGGGGGRGQVTLSAWSGHNKLLKEGNINQLWLVWNLFKVNICHGSGFQNSMGRPAMGTFVWLLLLVMLLLFFFRHSMFWSVIRIYQDRKLMLPWPVFYINRPSHRQ